MTNYKKITLIVVVLLICNTGFSQCWKMISVGEGHNVGIRDDGTMLSWGRYSSGFLLGNGSTFDALVPMQIGTSTEWKDVSASADYTLALKNNGTLWAWGANSFGNLGDGTTTTRNFPIQIGTATWKMVRTGGFHSLGIKSDGTLWAWGRNEDATLGDGTFVNKLVPTQISSATNWVSISCNYPRSVALKADGTLWTWGLNSPALGLGIDAAGIPYITTPTQIGTDTDWKIAVVGSYHTLALKTNNTLWSWTGGDQGENGNGTGTYKPVPTQVGTDTNWASVEADAQTSFGTKTDGTLWAWGQNLNGQLGNGNQTNLLAPTQITTATNWRSVSTSYNATVAVTTDGSFYTWGDNQFGQLGTGNYDDHLTPMVINTCSLSVGDSATTEKFVIYPNPAESMVNIQLKGSATEMQFELYDMTGRLVQHQKVPELTETLTVHLNDLSTGVYVVLIKENAQVVLQKKLQKL